MPRCAATAAVASLSTNAAHPPAIPPAPLVGVLTWTWLLPATLVLGTHLQLVFSLLTSSLKALRTIQRPAKPRK